MNFFALAQRINRGMPVVARLVPRQLRRYALVRFCGVGKDFSPPPSRAWLENEVLPRLARFGYSRILFVGVAPYTRDYERIITRSGGSVVTCDRNRSAEVWGARQHVRTSIQQITEWFGLGAFDSVILNGVFGFGVDSESDMNSAVAAVALVLRPAGLLLIGWNTNLTPDPLNLIEMRRAFAPGSGVPFPDRRAFANETHVYDFQFRRASDQR